MNTLAGLWIIFAWCWLVWIVNQHLKDHRPHQ